MLTAWQSTNGGAPMFGVAQGSYTVMTGGTTQFLVHTVGTFMQMRTNTRWRAGRSLGSNRFTRNWSLPGDRKIPMPMVAPIPSAPVFYLQAVKRAAFI